VKQLALAVVVCAMFCFGFIYAAVNTMCDENYWPDWA